MKKIIVSILLLSTIACSKPADNSAPTSSGGSGGSGTTVTRYHYTWSFKKANDPNHATYAGSACYTPAEMVSEQQSSGAFDVVKGYPC